MPPSKEPCRNFQRGSCQYGERCKFAHVNQQQAKPNPFGFGVQSRNDSQPPKPNPFGFGVQNNSKPNQFKPGENKWSRFSPLNAAANSSGPQKPDNQTSAPNHKCTDPVSCKSQITEDFEHEKPLWKLTCYGHCKNGPCDIVGDISFEELRATAYDDAKRGMSIQSIVEKERSLLSSKLVEFEGLLRNPYTPPPNSTHSANSSNVSPQITQNNSPLSVSSFSQLSTAFNGGFQMRPNSVFGQANQFQAPTQISTASENRFSFGNSGVGSQPATPTFGSSFPSTTSTFGFGNASLSNDRNTFSTAPSHDLDPAGHQSSVPFSVQNSSATDIQSMNNGNGDKSIWFKEEWRPGEIPEEAPPEEVIY